ncbi:DNA polymerase III subunit beta [Patescibacteria group bacterium]|nr:DNA polymerase III subunit beta [Patescibacteria group bacterium]MBU1703467.1 DNA polymerase III subunit beta [Patescibacteria group bacterium]MBU1953451.1 DNA polymerase III subunit beta [Patescibacteria group bacterium]
MKLVCSQADLERAINIVSKAITPNTTLPVLNNVLLKAEGKKLHFSATNLEVAVQYFIPADVKSEGSITVPAKLLSSYISLLKDEKVEISVTSGDTIEISSPSSHTKMKGINSNEFPVIPKVEKENTFKVSAAELERAISQTVFAASTNTSRPVLSGVLFDVKKDKLKVVATDSYRLAEKTITLKDKTSLEVECIVPARTVMELGKILVRMGEEQVEVNISKNQILFVAGDVQLMSRLIEGKYPPYEKVVPKETKTKLEIMDEALANVVRRVSLFARENNNSIKLSATNDGKLTISTDETRVGEEKAELTVKITGDNNKIALNAQYLLDVLNYIQSDSVLVEIDDKLSPAVVRPVKEKDYVYIIMPLKI